MNMNLTKGKLKVKGLVLNQGEWSIVQVTHSEDLICHDPLVFQAGTGLTPP